MTDTLNSPWLAVSLAIIAMTVGYVFYMQSNGTVAAANSYSCPAQQICESAKCMNNGCNKTECGHCSYCQGKTS